jgi:hypothetical protein
MIKSTSFRAIAAGSKAKLKALDVLTSSCFVSVSYPRKDTSTVFLKDCWGL